MGRNVSHNLIDLVLGGTVVVVAIAVAMLGVLFSGLMAWGILMWVLRLVGVAS
jgi:hypothetical protein